MLRGAIARFAPPSNTTGATKSELRFMILACRQRQTGQGDNLSDGKWGVLNR